MIDIPAPFPGEIAAGYGWRAARTHGFDSADLMLKQVRSALSGGAPLPSLQKVEILAGACEVPLQAFVRSHTLLPLLRMVRDNGSAHAFGDSRYPARLSGSMHLLRDKVYFCSACVSEDLSFHGISYWRRDHQVRGAWRCEKHPQQLLRYGAQLTIREAPSNVRFRCATSVAVKPERSHAATRLVSICQSLLERDRPLEIDSVVAVIRDRARSLGIRTFNAETGTVLSDVVMDTFDATWLLEVCPQLSCKRPGKQVRGIDDWVTTRTPIANGWSLPTILATLWESADDAVSSVACRPATARSSPGKQQLRNSETPQ